MSAEDDDNDGDATGRGRGPYDDNDFPDDAFDGGNDDGFFDNDDPFADEEEGEEGNNDLWEEVVDDDGEELAEEEEEEEEVVLDDEGEFVEEEEIVEEEFMVADENNQATSNSSNLDDQRNSMHSLGMWSVDNSASVDFDLGSYAEMSSHASDNFVPDDYEDACRKLLEIIQPNIDPDDMIRRCDHKTLYANLREQYRHLVHKHPELAASSAAGQAGGGSAIAPPGNHGNGNNTDDHGGGVGSGGLWGSEGGSTNNEVDDNDNDNTFFSGGPFHAGGGSDAAAAAAAAGDDDNMNMNDQWPEDGGFDDDDADDGNIEHTAADPFESAGQSNAQSDGDARASNAAKATNTSFDSNDTEIEVEKWLERNADDPDDYDYACRKLIKVIYGPDSPDHDPDTMMRRTSAPDLYRYLKNEYWFKVHTGELKEGMDQSSHHGGINNNSNKNKSANQGISNQDSVSSFEEAPRLKDTVEGDVGSDSALPREEKDTNQGESDDEDIDTKQSHSGQAEVVGQDERSIEQSVDSVQPSAEVRGGAQDIAMTDKIIPKNNDTRFVESNAFKTTNSDIKGDSTGDLSVLEKEEAYDVVKVTAEDVPAETEHEETQTDSAIIPESAPEDPEAALLYELQRLKEEEARLLEEEEKLREEAMRIQISQREMQNINPDSVDELEGNVTQVQLVDERTENLHRSGLLIREMSSESIIETSEEESDEDHSTHTGEVDQLAGSDNHSASSGKSDRFRTTEKVTTVTESPDDDDPEAELLRQERFERYTREYNDILDRQDRGEDIDEDRLYLLELAVRKRLDEELTEDELAELKDFDAAEVAYDSAPHSNNSNYPEEAGEEQPNVADIDSKKEATDDDRSLDESSAVGEGSTVGNEKVVVTDVIDEGLKGTNKKAEETEWRKRKIEADLADLVQRAEEEELGDLVTTEAMVALKMAASRVALSKKYFDDDTNDYIYFPSVAKCIYDFSLIEEAEKYYLDGSDDFPMELSTALCTIASSKLNGDVQEVDENDEDIMEKAVEVNVDLCEPNESVETVLRKTMIDEELSTLVLDAEQQELDSDFSPSVVSVLKEAAFKVAYTRKYRDGDKFIYFPSVAKTVYSSALLDQAEEIIQDSDMEEIPTEYVNALCTVAASYLTGNTNEVDPEDEFVKKTAVDIDMPNDSIRAVKNDEIDKMSSRHDESHNGSNGHLSDSVTSDVQESGNSVSQEVSRDLARQERQDTGEAADSDDGGATNDDSTRSEIQEREQMISDDFARLIQETEEKEIDGTLDEEMVNALKDAAGKICYVKKFFDVTTDAFVYYPSVAKSIIDYKLFEASGNDSLDFPPDQVSSIRAVAATLVKSSEPDESDDYVFNMTVDVELHQLAKTDKEKISPANENPSPSDEDSAVEKEAFSPAEENANTGSPSDEGAPQGKISESMRCAQMVADELDRLIRDTEEEEELDEPFDQESIDALRIAAHKVAYRKKFYSVLEDEVIYYPSVARTIVDYSLFDAATEAYGDDEDEFPGDLTAALRAVGMSRMMDDDMDYDYMDSLATPIEDEDDRGSVNGGESPSDDGEKGTSAPNSPITTPEAPDSQDLSASPNTEDAKGTTPTPNVLPGDDSGFEIPVGTEGLLSDSTQDSSHVEPRTEPTKETTPDSSDATPSSTSPVVASKDHSSISAKPQLNRDEIEAEEERLNEMAEILEFKRRQDKQKISDDAKALEELKSSISRDVIERTNALKEDIRQKEHQLEEESALLFEKWQEDNRKVDKALAELISRNNSELERIETEIKTMQTSLASEKERIDNGLRDIEQQRQDDEITLPQKYQALRAKQATARTTLEALKKSIEDEMKEADQPDVDPKEDKGRSFFGFGSSRKKQQLEQEKLKQAKLMELRIKEMELEKEIDEIGSEEDRLKDQAKTRERQRLELQSQLRKDSEALEISSRSADEKLAALTDERKQLETDFSEQQRNLLSQKQTLQETRKEDEAWVAAEKVKLAELFEQGQSEIDDWANLQQEKQLKEEERLSNTALALKEKWVKEEEAFEKDVDFLEQTKAQLGILKNPRTLYQEEQRSTHDGTSPHNGESPSQTGDFSNETSLPSREENLVTVESTPDHLIGLNQPIDESNDSSSVKSHELFDPPANAPAQTKPLLAAALKAKEQQTELSKSLSQLQIFDSEQHENRKKGGVDLSASVPDHLIAMNQPKSHQYERTSIRELELFDVPEEREVEQKPLLAAALRAKQQSQLGVSLSGLDILKESKTEDATNDFSKSVPINISRDQEVDISRQQSNDQSLQGQESDSHSSADSFNVRTDEQIPNENPFPTTVQEAEGGQGKQNDETLTKEIQEVLPKKTQKPKIGHDMSALFHEAKSVSLKKAQEEYTPSASEIAVDADDNVKPLRDDSFIDQNTSPVEPVQTHEAEISSGPERMSWWQKNGKNLVATQFDSTREPEKAKLEESLIQHNIRITESRTKSSEHIEPTAPVVTESGQDISTPAKASVSLVPSSLEEKRRKAAEARARALAIRTGGVHSSPGSSKTDVLLSPKDKFKQTQQQLQQRVDASKIPKSPVSPSGNARALEWQVAANQKPQIDTEDGKSNRGKNSQSSDHLAWWRKNGKRLVAEKLGRKFAPSPSIDSKQDFREAEARRIAERTQLVRESRLAQEITRSVPSGTISDPNSTLLMPSIDGRPKEKSHPTLLYPMIRETNRLSGFIRRYENKLENVCRSLLSVASETNNDQGAVAAKDLPLTDMVDYIQNADWFKAQSALTGSNGQNFQPQLMFSRRDSMQRQESKKAFLSEMSKETEKMSDSKSYKVTAVGHAFLQMDGPVQADVGRFLAHLVRASSASESDGSDIGLTQEDMKTRWSDIAQLSGDVQSQRIYDNLDGLISFCLEAHMIQ